MIPIDDNTIAVENAAELKQYLEADNQYTTIYLAEDIEMTSGISIFRGKTKVIIDGTYPLDGTGVRHSFTDYLSGATSGPIGVRATPTNGGMNVIFRNLDVYVRNYYGLFYTAGGTGYANVVVTFQNVNFEGAQTCYSDYGGVEYIDSNIHITRLPSGGTPSQEVAEINRVTMKGAVTFNHEPQDNRPMFWMRGTSATTGITIDDDAVVTITTTQALIDSGNDPFLTVGRNARVNITAAQGLCADSGDTFSDIIISDRARFSYVQTARNAGYASTYIKGAFEVYDKAQVMFYANYSNVNPLIRFTTSSASFKLQEPKRAVFDAQTGNAFYFVYATSFSLTTRQINLWRLAGRSLVHGPPNFHWSFVDSALIEITGKLSNGSFSVTTSNIDDPPLGNMVLNTAKAYSVGDLSISLNAITETTTTITGKTDANTDLKVNYTIDSADYEFTGIADENGIFSIDITPAIPQGVDVTVTVENGYFYSAKTVTVVYPGEIGILSAPETMRFSLKTVIQEPKLLKRIDPETITVVVEDNRVSSSKWKLYVSSRGPLVGKKSVLVDAVAFVDYFGNVTIVGETPVLVYEGVAKESEEENATTTIMWNESRGILMAAGKNKFIKGEVYRGKLDWTIELE